MSCPPSPLRNSTIYSPPLPSQSTMRAPPPKSPLLSRRDIVSDSARGWSSPGATNGAKRTPSAHGGDSTDSVGAGGRVNTAKGAEGGPSAIGERRRGSNSFKTMTTGSLVKNSPFAQRLGTTGALPPPMPTSPGKSYFGSRSPQTTRNVSGTPRKVSSEQEERVKENEGGRRRVSGEDEGKEREDRSMSSSPSVPFRPTRTPVTSSYPSAAPKSPYTTTGSGFKPTRSVVPDKEDSRRKSSAYAAARSANAVSSSPFISRLTPASPSPTLSSSSYGASPAMPSDMFSPSSPLPTLSHQSSRDQFKRMSVTDEDDDDDAGMGLGIRPGGSHASERRIAGSSVPPPNTPPAERQRSASGSPSSALSMARRGMKGPRPPSASEAEFDGGDDTETEDEGRTLRRKASTKTVTWAPTEEVLEFTAEAEEERRRSGASEISSEEGAAGWRNSADYSLDAEGSFAFEESNVSGAGFEEGGSVEVHEYDSRDDYGEEDDEDPALLSVDLMDDIDNLLSNEVCSPSLISDDYNSAFDVGVLDFASPKASSSPLPPTPTTSQPRFGYSRTFRQPQSDSEVEQDGANSESSYDDDEETAMQAVRAQNASRMMMGEYGSPPKQAFASLPAVGSYSNVPSSPGGYLPHLRNSPFVGGFESGTPRLATPSTFASTSVPTQSTPNDNSITSSFIDASPPVQHLSRHASLVDPEASSNYGSVRSAHSLRGASSFGERGQLLDEKMRAHAALQAASSSTSSDMGRYSSAPTPDSSSSRPMQSFHSAPPPAARVIQTQPALKARPITLSSSIQGAPIGTHRDAVVDNGMQSPLDRFQRGANKPWEESDIEEEGEVASTSMVTSGRPLSTMDLHTAQINASRKNRDSTDSGRHWASGGAVAVATPGLTRRRSLSTGDASGEPGSAPMNKRFTMPEAGFASRLDAALPSREAAFSSTLESSLEHVYANRDRGYRVREPKTIVYANDGNVVTVGSAGDVDPGGVWRRKRPSDMNSVMSKKDLVSGRATSAHDGQVFVTLVEAQFDSLPGSQQITKVKCLLNNGGRNSVPAGTFKLGQSIMLKREFDLTCSSSLEFSIKLEIPISEDINSHLIAPSSRSLPLPPAPSPTKSPSRLRSVFSSPKKKAVDRTPLPEPILQYRAADGTFAVVNCIFKSEASKCRLKTSRIDLPFERNASSHTVVGALTLELYYLPSIPGIEKKLLPQSVAEAKKGVSLAEWHGRHRLEGVLTQLGGDCGTWKRRNFKLEGTTLTPYSEITKKAYVELGLSTVTRLEDPNAPTSSVTSDGIKRSPSLDIDEQPWRMAHSFVLHFAQSESIGFFADSAADKEEWMKVLGEVIGKRAAPEWAIALRKLQS